MSDSQDKPDYRYLALRTALVLAACACAIAGVLLLGAAGSQQLREETVTADVTRADAQAQVLLVLSYSDSDAVTVLERAGVLDVMGRSAVAVDVEYLDALRCPQGSPAYDAWVKALQGKLQARTPYHAVICADDEALSFVADRHDTLFADVPVVFFGVNDFDNAKAVARQGYATGILEQADIADTVRLAQALRPDARAIVAIVDDSPAGKGDRAQFDHAARSSNLEVRYVNASEVTRDALAQVVGNADDDSIVFFLDASNDVTGATFTRDESARLVAAASKQPVFGIASGAMGSGVVASGFTDPEADGQRAAALCIDILNGTSPASLPVQDQGTGGFVFDAQAMQQHGISENALPANAVVVNRAPSVWDSIRPLLPAVAFIVAALAFVIAFAVLGYRRAARNARAAAERQQQLQRTFYYDQLTDLPNLAWFEEHKADPGQTDAVKSVVKVDLADACEACDLGNQGIDDDVVSQVAQRLKGVPSSFLVRGAGQDFLLGLDHAVEPDGEELENLNRMLAQPIEDGDTESPINLYMGVANRADGAVIDDAVAEAECAVRQAKRSALGCVPVLYRAGMREVSDDRSQVVSLLKQSIEDESFVVLYQPQVDVRSNEVVGYEALVRLKGNAYNPGQFIPIAETSGLVIDVDRIVAKKVVQQLATWKRRHKRLAPVAINYSAVQLNDEGYLDFLFDLLDKNEVPPSMVAVEITESLFEGDKEKVDQLVERLGDAGITLALDNFGTASASLSHMANIPAQVVNVDKSLVDACTEPGGEQLLDSLVRFLHGLDKKVVVEGVETPEQLQVCQKLGCDIVQGYYFSEPQLPEKAVQFKPSAD